VVFNIFIYLLAAEITAHLQLCSPWLFFAFLFWAAGGQIAFWREGFKNLEPPLNALFNSRTE
jgi:hypothetical protein